LFRRRPGEEWLARLAKHGVPAGPINTMDRVAAHPQVAAREMLVEVDHAHGAVTIPTIPWKTGLPAERAPVPPLIPPPLLGQHTAEVLCTLLQYTPERVAQLVAQGVVA
ncbi:MAG TPA: CoA transferase, partial [Chloroflexota bacterium]|nr:CoA transferase [Chloroflexota bacterium]